MAHGTEVGGSCARRPGRPLLGSSAHSTSHHPATGWAEPSARTEVWGHLLLPSEGSQLSRGGNHRVSLGRLPGRALWLLQGPLALSPHLGSQLTSHHFPLCSLMCSCLGSFPPPPPNSLGSQGLCMYPLFKGLLSLGLHVTGFSSRDPKGLPGSPKSPFPPSSVHFLPQWHLIQSVIFHLLICLQGSSHGGKADCSQCLNQACTRQVLSKDFWNTFILLGCSEMTTNCR